jgi:hypothetical protein
MKCVVHSAPSSHEQGLKIPSDTSQSEKGAETPTDKGQRLAF